ncbi:MAG: hypothetical protein QXN59_01265 [Candidatus Micrarchaeaceae archaeon]
MDKSTPVFLGLILVSAIFLVMAEALPSSLVTVFGKLLFIILSLIFDVMAFSSRHYSQIIRRMITHPGKRIVLSKDDPYWMSPSEDSILRKDGEDFIATVYVRIPLYKSATEMSPEESLQFSKQLSAMIGLNKSPIRYSVQLSIMNKDNYLQQIRDMIEKSEGAEASAVEANSDQALIERSKGITGMWRGMLENASKIQSLELIAYASISAIGSKEFEAVSAAQQRAREIISGVGTIFGISPTFITGQELKSVIDPESLLPSGTVSEQMAAAIKDEVI